MKLKTMYVVLLYYVAGFIVFSVKRKYRKKKILTNSLKSGQTRSTRED